MVLAWDHCPWEPPAPLLVCNRCHTFNDLVRSVGTLRPSDWPAPDSDRDGRRRSTAGRHQPRGSRVAHRRRSPTRPL